MNMCNDPNFEHLYFFSDGTPENIMYVLKF